MSADSSFSEGLHPLQRGAFSNPNGTSHNPFMVLLAVSDFCG